MTAIQRAELAEEYFRLGYNCAQAVALAFSDIFVGIDKEQVAALTSGFGGGMGRLREVCGAFSACVLVAGQLRPAIDPNNIVQRTDNYALVQELAYKFKEVNGGSIICRELLQLDKCSESPVPSERNSEYYKKRPCAQKVYNAALILAQAMQ